jgi:putative transposase
MFTVNKIRLNLTEKEINILESQSKICNKLYNELLSLVKDEMLWYELYQFNQSFNPNLTFSIRDQATKLKNKHNYYKSVYSSVIANVAFKLKYAISLWRNSLNKKENFGFPKYRSYKRNGFLTLTYSEPFSGYKIKNKSIILSLGKILQQNGKGKQNNVILPFFGKLNFNLDQIKVLEIIKDKGEYFACFTLAKALSEKKPIKNIVALDPNHKNLAVSYDNKGQSIEFQNLYHVKVIDKRIGDIKSKRDKCKKLSRRWHYLNEKVLEVYRVRRKQIQVGFRTIANYLCKHYDLIGIGDYVPKPKSKNKKKSKEDVVINNAIITKSNIGEFRKVLAQVCERSGKTFIKYDEAYTTRMCNTCCYIGEAIPVEVREWLCWECGSYHVRDENAAMNGYKIITNTHMLPGSGHLEVRNRWACKFIDSELSMKEQEIKSREANSIS